MILVVHNKHDKASRDFVANLPSDQLVVDFYDYDSPDRKLLECIDIAVSAFPTVIDTELQLAIAMPSSIEECLSTFKVKRDSDEYAKYLKDTDYLIIREMEGGAACPVEIKQARAAARLKVVE